MKPADYLVENCVFNYGGNPKESPQLERPIIGVGANFYVTGKFKNCIFNRTGTTSIDNMLYQSHDEIDGYTILNGGADLAIGENVTFENCKMTVANGANNIKVNPRMWLYTPKEFDTVPTLKFVNFNGLPLSFTLVENSFGQRYKIITEGTEVVS